MGPRGRADTAQRQLTVAEPRVDFEEEHRRLAEAQRLAMIGSFEMDLDTGVIEWSGELRRILAVPPDERPSAAGFIRRVHPDDMGRYGAAVQEWVDGRAAHVEETFRMVTDGGVTRHVHLRLLRRAGADGHRYLSGTLQDITERREAEEARRVAEEQFSLAFEQAKVGMATLSLSRVITKVNGALCAMLGRSADELVGRSPDEFAHPDDLAASQPTLLARLFVAAGGRLEAERRWIRADGSVILTNCHLTLVRSEDGEPRYVFAQLEDVTERKRQEEEIRRLALEDPLTGLPNRQLLRDRIDQALRRARQGSTHVAVLLVDIDFFKRVNESLGRDAGDELLVEVGRRIVAGHGPDATVARLSGDEFVVLHESVEGIEQARAAGATLQAMFVAPFVVDDDEMVITASCGLAVGKGDECAEDLLRDAEVAMYVAKGRGGAQTATFEESLGRRARSRLSLEATLRRAVERREFCAFFQPVVHLADDRIVGVEALARWRHPTRGLLGPVEFISVAEDIGLIGRIGEQVMEAALEELARWRREVPGWDGLFVAVNLSPRQLVAADLRERCLEALARHGLPPPVLQLEVTESTLMDDPDASAAILRRLSDEGIGIAMDDFGTGYSSLSRLKQLPVSTLKIDRSFVDGLGSDPSDTSIVRAIVGLGHALALELCAEGVELPSQRDELTELGCHHAQGYLWAPPMAAAELVRAFGPVPAHD